MDFGHYLRQIGKNLKLGHQPNGLKQNLAHSELVSKQFFIGQMYLVFGCEVISAKRIKNRLLDFPYLFAAILENNELFMEIYF